MQLIIKCNHLVTILTVLIQLTYVRSEEPKGKYCTGSNQSPINIDTGKVQLDKLNDLVFSEDFYKTPLSQTVHSDNHTIVIISKYKNKPTILGGPLNCSYALHSIHFHWAMNDNEGSEHTINAHAYPLEMHAVFTKDDMSFDDALLTHDGLAVIGYLFRIKRSWFRAGSMAPVTDTVDNLQEVLVPEEVKNKFPVGKLVQPFKKHFYTYPGSLTTGDCNEVATWIVPKKMLSLTRKQMQSLRDLFPRRLVTDPTNYRAVQPLYFRTVVYDKN